MPHKKENPIVPLDMGRPLFYIEAMKRSVVSIIVVCLSVLFSAGILSAVERVDAVTARRVAEYYGKVIFKTGLTACAYEVLTWPSGEPAAYAVTLVRAGDFATPDILLDNTLLAGAALVAAGRSREGYLMMAQTDRYKTVVVGASTDMPSLIKAHAGLPEHVLASVLMSGLPSEPRWIYADPFHTLVASNLDAERPGATAREIHTDETVVLAEVEGRKSSAIPPAAEAAEWGRFLHPELAPPAAQISFPGLNGGVIEGTHLLSVAEFNTSTVWKGCHPAAVFNCTKFHAKNGKIGLQGKSDAVIMDWIAVACRTNPVGGATYGDDIEEGPWTFYHGLGYQVGIQWIFREIVQSDPFLAQYAGEINAGFPAILSAGEGIFRSHATTGIGYEKTGALAMIIVHDGWKSTPAPVYVKYLGYPAAECQYPETMLTLRPGASENFPVAVPKFKALLEVIYSPTQKKWPWRYSITSDPSVDIYREEISYYDAAGKRYLHIMPRRIYPFLSYTWRTKAWNNLTKPAIKSGKFVWKVNLIDGSGHLLVLSITVKLKDAVTGKWLVKYDWKGMVEPGPATWTLYDTGKFKDDYSGFGLWTLTGLNFNLTYQSGAWAIYTGTVNPACTSMSGTMKAGTKMSGVWTGALKTRVTTSPPLTATPGSGVRTDGGQKAP